MYFLQDYFASNTRAKKIAMESSTFSAGYKFWLNFLFERAVRRFEYKGLPESMPQHEIEVPLQMQGTVGVSKKADEEIRAFNGSWSGAPTVYFDTYKKYAVYSPIFSDVLKVDTDVIVGLNDSLQNATYPLCHRYATLLAHLETSLVDTLIDGRNTSGIPVVKTETQRMAVESFRNSLANGTLKPIFDANTFSPIQWEAVSKNVSFTVTELIEARENLLNAFYQDIGVRTVWNKKGNMIADEVGGNQPLLLQNVSDMLNQRKKMCEKINNLYGTNITVDLAPELKYNEEKEDVEDGTNNFEENTDR